MTMRTMVRSGVQWFAPLLISFVAANALSAQTPDAAALAARADSAFEGCLAATESGQEAESRTAGDLADRLYRDLTELQGYEADGLTGRANVRSRCRIPFANFMRQGALAEESIELTRRALAADSMHLYARFLLAMNLYSMPAFLGRATEAEREFEVLIAMHGDRVDASEVRLAYALLGDLYVNAKRTDDALRVWQRGLERWPGDAGLRERIDKHGGVPDADRSPAHAPVSTTGASAVPGAAAARGSDAPHYALVPIVVEAGGVSMEGSRGATRLTKLDVYTAPGGAADVLQVFQTMPGVTRVNDGSDLYVRGGDPAETPVFVDGARLFYSGTFESLSGSVFGVLDPAVLKRAHFSSGGFSARFGNALSGVLDVETDGRPTATSWRAGANLASIGGTLRLPLGARSGAWASITGTDATALIHMQDRAADYPSSPRALKAIAGAVHEPLPGIELRATTLVEHDRTEVMADAHGWNGPFRSVGGTRLATLSLRALRPDGAAGLRAGLSWSERETGFAFGVLDRERTDRFTGARVEIERAWRSGVTLRSGIEAALFSFVERGTVPETEAIAPGSPSAEATSDAATHHAGVYVEAETRLAPRLALIVGARADRLPGEDAWTADPRLAVAYRAGDWTLRAGTGIFHQGRWRVRYRLPDAGSPAGVPTLARHYVVGAQRDGTVSLRVEAYRKEWRGYVSDGGRGPETVEGDALGLDLFARWTAGRHQGWITWSWLDGAVELETGERVPSAAAVTHSVTGVVRRSLGTHWEIGSTGRYATGRPFTPAQGRNADTTPRYGGVHSEHLPTYFRLDSRLMHLRPAGGGVWVFYLEGLNLLDRRNVSAYVWDSAYLERRPVHSFFSRRTFVLGVEAQF